MLRPFKQALFSEQQLPLSTDPQQYTKEFNEMMTAIFLLSATTLLATATAGPLPNSTLTTRKLWLLASPNVYNYT